MAKYSISLTEAEAKALREIYDNPQITSKLKRQTLEALIRIGQRIERQADWKTW